MIEFLEDVHTYVCDGVIIPSVSELIRFKFPEAYKGIPERILKRKADYGTKVHRTIEEYVNGTPLEEIEQRNIDPNVKIAVEQFITLRKKWAFYVKDMEQIVCYKNKYAGTYDIRCEDDYLIDIKTTAELHEEWLRWQLSLYYLALGVKKDYGFCLWLPKGKAGKVIQINTFPEEECVKLVKDYEAYSSAK